MFRYLRCGIRAPRNMDHFDSTTWTSPGGYDAVQALQHLMRVANEYCTAHDLLLRSVDVDFLQ